MPRSVNIFIWSRASRSIMKQMIASWSMVMVHGLMVAGPGIKPLARCWARKTVFRRFVSSQAGFSPQIYFITGLGPFRFPSPGKSVDCETLWSIWVVASLILSRFTYLPLDINDVPKSSFSNGNQCALMRVRWTLPLTGRHKLPVEFFSRPPSAGRRLRFRRLWMKTGLELI